MSRLVTAVTVCGVIALLGGCKEDAPKAVEIRPVRTEVVDPKPIDDDRQAVGEIKPRYETDFGFRLSGKLISRAVDIGVSVKKGDLLARLDDTEYQARLRSAEAEIASAEAVLVEADAAEGRLRQLLTSGTTTRANYDVAVKNQRGAQAKLCLLYTSPSPRDGLLSRMPSSA